MVIYRKIELLIQRVPVVLTCGILASLILVALLGVLHNDFIGFDDGIYVAQNPHVINGFTWANVCWAFQAGYAGNWHPLTWLSLMLDAQLFGHSAMGFHLTNLLLHIANTILLFHILTRLTGAQWRSAFVAALFALHPLHVESVAWVAERKDVLSTFFFLLTLWAYAAYADKLRSNSALGIIELPLPTRPASVSDSLSPALNPVFYYVLALILFALGLMSKPMLVTTPLLLLLLDYWPLCRLSFPSRQHYLPTLARLVWEKVPFLCLAIAASVLTFVAAGKGHAFVTGLPFAVRLANAIASYWKYLGMMIWPAGLAVFYPHPDIRYPASEQWPGWVICAGAIGLAALSAAVWFCRKRRPWLVVGWFWFLGTLVPVIGIVQVGDQAMADRYTYLPLIGIFLCVAWESTDLLAGRRLGRAILASCAIIVITSCLVIAHRQVKYWRNTQTLFEHSLTVTKNNAPAQFELGTVFEEQGDFEAAMSHYRASLDADPSYIFAGERLGFILEQLGKPDEACMQYKATLRFAPWWALPHNRLASCLWALGLREEARQQYMETIRLDPDYAEAHFNLGVALYKLGKPESALPQLTEAVQLEPMNITAQMTLAEMLLKMGKFEEAQSGFVRVIHLCPSNTEARLNLGGIFFRQNRQNEALQEFAEATRQSPENSVAHFDLATALFSQGRFSDATSQFAEAMRLKPGYLEARFGLDQSLAAQTNWHSHSDLITNAFMPSTPH